MSSTNCILQIPCAKSSEVILVNVEQLSSSGTDLKILATEGENGYAANIKGDLLKGCKDLKYEGTAGERKAALSWVLLSRLNDPSHGSLVRAVEATATLQPAKSIDLSLREKLPEGYTRLLAVIELRYDSELEIELFDWTKSAAQATKTNLDRCSDLKGMMRSRDEELAALRQQLDDLSQAKRSHEDQLLEKFRLLLNSKKLKIRDQQRLLAGMNGNANGTTIAQARQGEQNALPHRGAIKRKAASEQRAPSESSDGFGVAKKDPNGEADEDSDEAADGINTPNMSDPDTEDEQPLGRPPRESAREPPKSAPSSSTAAQHTLNTSVANDQSMENAPSDGGDETDEEL